MHFDFHCCAFTANKVIIFDGKKIQLRGAFISIYLANIIFHHLLKVNWNPSYDEQAQDRYVVLIATLT